MAIVLTDDKHYKNIADVMRTNSVHHKSGRFQPADMSFSLQTIFDDRTGEDWSNGYKDGFEQGEEQGYDDGYDNGLNDGYDMGYRTGYDDGWGAGLTEGKQAEHDAFWESYLTPPQYDNVFGFGMFAGIAWNENNCNPNLKTHKTITPKYATYMFAYNAYIQDLDEWCERNNLTIDFSQNRNFSYTFYGMGSHLKSVGIIDTRSAPTVANCFYGAEGLHTIKHLILKDDGSQSLNSTFTRNTSLENITISGKIGTSLANFSESTLLTHKSLMSIIDALYDYNGTATTRTITLGATNLAKLTDAEKAIATQKGWTLA